MFLVNAVGFSLGRQHTLESIVEPLVIALSTLWKRSNVNGYRSIEEWGGTCLTSGIRAKYYFCYSGKILNLESNIIEALSEIMNYWKLITLIGVALLVISIFFGFYNVYLSIPYWLGYTFSFAMIPYVIPNVTSAILFPLAIAFGLFSVLKLKPKLALLAGILAIICFAIPVYYMAIYRYWEFDVVLGLAGAVMLLISYPISKSMAESVNVAYQAPFPSLQMPPPPPSPQAFYPCPTCGGPLTFVPEYNRWYCQNCQKYP